MSHLARNAIGEDTQNTYTPFKANGTELLQVSIQIITTKAYSDEVDFLQIMDCSASMTWDDIAGLQFAKKTIKEIIVLPMLRP